MHVQTMASLWRYIPKDLPIRAACERLPLLVPLGGTSEKSHHTLCVKCRERVTRSRSDPATPTREIGGTAINIYGFDAGKLM